MGQQVWLGRLKRLLRHEYADVIFIIIEVRLLLFAASLWLAPIGLLSGYSLNDALISLWQQWDSNWYVSIAEAGYVSWGSQAFFPLYPLLIRLLALVIPSVHFAALLVANVAAVFGLLVFYLLTKRELGPTVAWWSLMALLLFPSAYFFGAPYTESLFLLFSVGSFYLARQGRWRLAGIVGGLAALTRLAGLILLPALLIEYWLQRREGVRSAQQVLWLALIPGAFGVYLLLNFLSAGSPWHFLVLEQRIWNHRWSWPGLGLVSLIQQPLAGTLSDIIADRILYLVVAVITAVASLATFFRLRLSYAVFTGFTLLIIYSTTVLSSSPRYVLGAFPIFMIIGQLLATTRLRYVWLFISAALLIVMLGRYTAGLWAY